VLTEQDFEEANVEATRQIDILDFVSFAGYRPALRRAPLLPGPAQRLAKSRTQLLREVLRRSGKAGVGQSRDSHAPTFGGRGRARRRPAAGVLRFADELRDTARAGATEHDLKTLGVTPKELSMAERLVEGMV